MSTTKAPITGGVTSILGGAGSTQLAPEKKACRQISIRSHTGNSEISIGHSDVVHATRWAYIDATESWTWGPFESGVGIRPCDIYLLGTTLDAVTWSGVHA